MSEQPARANPPEILFQGKGGRTLLFQFAAGQGLPPHSHKGQGVTVATLAGRVQFTVDGKATELEAGETYATATAETFSMLALADGSRVLVALIER